MTSERWRVEHDDCIDVLERMPAESVDAVVTDPPYGLSAEPNITEVLTHWLAGDDYRHRGGGFMGQAWDSFVPGPAVWRECLRVLKPGGHLLAFGGTRTVDLLTIAIRLAGFEVRDRVLTLNGHVLGSELDWIYANGWPKSLNVGKAVDESLGAERAVVGTKIGLPGYSLAQSKGSSVYGEGFGGRGDPEREAEITAPATPEAERWEGWGTALKPAHEPIVVARKPLRGTVAANVMAHGTGALNIDACRIATSDPNLSIERRLGRWPANVALIHSPGCERVGTKRIKPVGATARTEAHGKGRILNHGGNGAAHPGYREEDGLETIEAWVCEPGCPVAQLDALSGRLSSGEPTVVRASTGGVRNAYGAELRPEGTPLTGYGDAGGASRFFYSGKASQAERDAGLDAFEWVTCRPARNVHPTVKPIDLMRWLVRLVTPPDGVVLDPFAGSGSTGCAAALEGMRFVGVEQDAGHVEVARARIGFWGGFPAGTPTGRVLAQESARRRDVDEARERWRERAEAGQLDLLAGAEDMPHG